MSEPNDFQREADDIINTSTLGSEQALEILRACAQLANEGHNVDFAATINRAAKYLEAENQVAALGYNLWVIVRGFVESAKHGMRA